MAGKVNDEASQAAIDYLPNVGTPDGVTPDAVPTPSEDRKSAKTDSITNRDDEKGVADVTPTARTSFDELNGTDQVKYGPDGEPIIQNGE